MDEHHTERGTHLRRVAVRLARSAIGVQQEVIRALTHGFGASLPVRCQQAEVTAAAIVAATRVWVCDEERAEME